MKNRLYIIVVFFSMLVSSAHALNYETEIHSKHFVYGCPSGTDITNDLIIRDLYALSSNDRTKFADWVAYRLDSSAISGKSIKKRVWKADPMLDENETLEPGDYKGANKALKCDRGHQAPLASFKGYKNSHEANYLSNITPQNAELNQGAWKRLEEAVRALVYKSGEVFVMTGPIYSESQTAKLPGADEEHVIPSGYWKIVCVKTSKTKLEAAAFIFDQKTPRTDKIMKHICSVDEVENQTGLDFFRLMNEKTETALEQKINTKWAERHFNK